MKTLLLALLLASPAAHATVSDFTYSLELDLQGMDSSAEPNLKGYQVSFDGYQVDTERDCQIDAFKKRLSCSGKGTVYPGLDTVSLRVQIPEALSAIGNLEYRFEEQSTKTSLPILLKDKKFIRTALAWEEQPAKAEALADAPIPTEAETIVEGAKKPGAPKSARQ